MYSALRDLDPEALAPDDPRWGWFTEDQLVVRHPDGRVLDVGWFPDNAPGGRFRIRLLDGRAPGEDVWTRSPREVLRRVGEVCGRVPSLTERVLREHVAHHRAGRPRRVAFPPLVVLEAWRDDPDPVPADVVEGLIDMWLIHPAFDPDPGPVTRVRTAVEAAHRYGSPQLSAVTERRGRGVLLAGLAGVLRRLPVGGRGDWDELGYAAGSEHDPGDPFGRCTLTVRADGAVTLVNVARGAERRFTGRCAPPVPGRLARLLDAAGFPRVPEHRIPPGPTRRLWTFADGHRTDAPVMGHHEAMAWEGYREVFHLLDSLVVAVSGGAVPVLTDPEPGLVEHRGAPR